MSNVFDPVEDRRAMIEWARAIVTTHDVVFLDTETTGFGPGTEIVDIAVVGVDGDILLDTLVKPYQPIPDGASRIHGIYDDQVQNAPPWKKVYPRLVKVLAMNTVVIYNADYDTDVIRECCGRDGLQAPLALWDCAMKSYSAFIGERSTHSRGGYRWFKLDQAARSCGIVPGTHRALADAEACRQVVHWMANSST